MACLHLAPRRAQHRIDRRCKNRATAHTEERLLWIGKLFVTCLIDEEYQAMWMHPQLLASGGAQLCAAHDAILSPWRASRRIRNRTPMRSRVIRRAATAPPHSAHQRASYWVAVSWYPGRYPGGFRGTRKG